MRHRTSRRTFIKTVGVTAAALGLAGLVPPISIEKAFASVQIPQTPLLGKNIPKYVNSLPTFLGARVDAATHTALTVTMNEIQQKVLPASIYAPLPAPYNAGAYVWGYGITDGTTTFGPHYPAFTIEAKKGTPINVQYANNLGSNTTFPALQKYISVDQTIHWADPLGNMDLMPMEPYAGPVPAVPHLHGGEVHSTSDGGPDSWFTPGLVHTGSAWSQGVSDMYSYPNGQEAATLWFHDHALGATRLNVYAGLAGFYLLRDDYDTGKVTPNPSNLPAGPYEIEIVIQDRMFDTNGQLLFPDGFPAGLNGAPPNPMVHPYWIPEFFGDVIVVNGASWPFLNVEPRRYRFRFLNGSNARFYDLSLGSKLSFWHVGTDGGLLDTPVNTPNLFIAPGERADIIVDFAPVAGASIVMSNSAKAPYPKGTAPNPATTGQIMQFRVAATATGTDTSFNPALGATLRGSSGQIPAIVRLVNPVAGTLGAGVTPDKTRLLILKEIASKAGPLEVLVNNTKWDGTLSPNAFGITEDPRVGSTEIWEIVNLTMDAHPMHIHLTQFQLMNRQPFNLTKYLAKWNSLFPAVTFNDVEYSGGEFIPGYGPPRPYSTLDAIGGNKLGGNPDVTPYLQGKATPPLPNEAGWKDTFKAFPGEVMRLVVRWAPQDITIGGVSAGTNTYPFNPTTGPGYVWHCHIVDHEDNEMMRPYRVAP